MIVLFILSDTNKSSKKIFVENQVVIISCLGEQLSSLYYKEIKEDQLQSLYIVDLR